jgi:hypothetical protein
MHMTLTQKCITNRITFDFQEDYVQYTRDTASHKVSFRIDYESFPTEQHFWEERKPLVRVLGTLALAWGMLPILFSTPTPLSVAWTLPGLLALLYYRLSITQYLVFDMPTRQIFLLANRQAETVLREVQARRIGQIRKRYARVIDPSEPERETARFQALLRENIITQDDFDDLMIDLRLGISANTPLED